MNLFEGAMYGVKNYPHGAKYITQIGRLQIMVK